jgi:hypothetical protein
MANPITDAMTHEYRRALVSALQNFKAKDRPEEIATALTKIEERERREALLAKLEGKSTDELERMLEERNPE